MPLDRPYYRIFRPQPDDSAFCAYGYDARYAPDRISLIRSYSVLQRDLLRLFEYVEPHDQNQSAFSIRTHELLLRACTDVEANCRAVLSANGYAFDNRSNMKNDYCRLEFATRLSAYRVRLESWSPKPLYIEPFGSWAGLHTQVTDAHQLPWYKAYNRAKHDRHESLHEATFEHVISAIAGALCILVSQFGVHAAEPSSQIKPYSQESDSDSADYQMLSPPRSIFDVAIFQQWGVDEQYCFDWHSLKQDAAPFQKFNFDSVM